MQEACRAECLEKVFILCESCLIHMELSSIWGNIIDIHLAMYKYLTNFYDFWLTLINISTYVLGNIISNANGMKIRQS